MCRELGQDWTAAIALVPEIGFEIPLQGSSMFFVAQPVQVAWQVVQRHLLALVSTNVFTQRMLM